MSTINDANFKHYYQKIVFETCTGNNEPFAVCNSKRKCLSQLYLSSNRVASNDAVCFSLEEELYPYTSVVDKHDEGAVNNYAKSSLALVAHSRNETQQWSCNLSNIEEVISKFMRPLDCELATDSIPNKCSSWDATEDNVLNLLSRNHKAEIQSYEREPAELDIFAHGTTLGSDAPVPAISTRKHMKIQEQDFSTFRKVFQPENNQKLMLQSNVFYQENNHPKKIFQTNNGFQPNYNNNMFQSNTDDCQKSSFQSHPRGGQAQNMFRTARDELGIQSMKKWGSAGVPDNNYGEGSNSFGQKKKLGTRRGVMNKFVPPLQPNIRDNFEGQFGGNYRQKHWENTEPEVDERLKNIDPKMVELIRNEIMDIGTTVTWDDIAGLEFAKSTIQEVVVWPLLRPDIFTGLRRPPKGILLFGPPGTGKTLIGKCIASQSHSTFFSISASSLTSKWIGDGEKMVRALFAVARCHQPAVVFIDEIDSLLTQRNDTEHESSRRIKTEFLVQLDGAGTGEEDRILVIGATNRPQELDEAARRRLVKKLYIPLPELQARRQIILRLMSSENHCLNEGEVQEISVLTDGYSGADMKSLCQEASLGPIRSLGFVDIQNIRPDEVRPVSFGDFKSALTRVRASVSPSDLDSYVAWDKMYGSGGTAVS